jgi:hypothetical protein
MRPLFLYFHTYIRPWISHCDSTAYENRFLFLVWRTRWTERIYSHVLLVVIPVPVSRSRVTVSNKWEVQVTNSRGLCWRVWTIESFAHPWIVAVISRGVYVLSDEGKKLFPASHPERRSRKCINMRGFSKCTFVLSIAYIPSGSSVHPLLL